MKCARVFVVLAAALCAPLSLAQTKVPEAIPAVSREVTLSGAVERPIVLTVDDLRKFPAGQIVTLVRPARADHLGEKEQKLTGVRLRDVLDRARPQVAGRGELKTMVIIAGASDGYKAAFSWSEIFNTAAGYGVLVAFDKDGAPLQADEGPIALVALGDLQNGPRHIKWLRELTFRQLAPR